MRLVAMLQSVVEVAAMLALACIGVMVLPFVTLHYWVKGDALWKSPEQRPRPTRGGYWDHR